MGTAWTACASGNGKHCHTEARSPGDAYAKWDNQMKSITCIAGSYVGGGLVMAVLCLRWGTKLELAHCLGSAIGSAEISVEQLQYAQCQDRSFRR